MIINSICHIDQNPTHYIITRKDLPIGFMAAQIVHAAGESVVSEVRPGTNAIVLEVDNERLLRELARKLSRSGIPHIVVYEPDPPWDGQMTAIGITPVTDRSIVKQFVKKLSLLGAGGCSDAQTLERKLAPSTTRP